MGSEHYWVRHLFGKIGEISHCNPVLLFNCPIFQPNRQTPKSLYQISTSKFPLSGDLANKRLASRHTLDVQNTKTKKKGKKNLQNKPNS